MTNNSLYKPDQIITNASEYEKRIDYRIKLYESFDNFYYWDDIKLTPELDPHKANEIKEKGRDGYIIVEGIFIAIDTYELILQKYDGVSLTRHSVNVVNKAVNFENDYERDRFYDDLMDVIELYKKGELTKIYKEPCRIQDAKWTTYLSDREDLKNKWVYTIDNKYK